MKYLLKPTQQTKKENPDAVNITINIEANTLTELFDIMNKNDIGKNAFHIFNVLEDKSKKYQPLFGVK